MKIKRNTYEHLKDYLIFGWTYVLISLSIHLNNNIEIVSFVKEAEINHSFFSCKEIDRSLFSVSRLIHFLFLYIVIEGDSSSRIAPKRNTFYIDNGLALNREEQKGKERKKK